MNEHDRGREEDWRRVREMARGIREDIERRRLAAGRFGAAGRVPPPPRGNLVTPAYVEASLRMFLSRLSDGEDPMRHVLVVTAPTGPNACRVEVVARTELGRLLVQDLREQGAVGEVIQMPRPPGS